jgi:general secretion pathway protein D
VPISQGGPTVQPQTQFDYRTIGVNIRITPRTHANDDVTLALNIELSSLGAPGFDGLPTFGKRNVSTSIRLKDGETNILAGLIREDERSERQTIPGLGDIPVVGNLFARNHTESQQTDVVVMLTPHIIRVLDLTEEDLRPLRLPREGTGTNFILPPTPTQTPPRLGPPSIPDLPGGP